MNKVILMGRLTRDPEVRYSAGENALAIARYTDGSAEMERHPLILSAVWYSDAEQSLQKNIFIRESVL